MIKRTLRGLIQLLGGLGAGLAIIMALAAWRLSTGPISLSFLTPYIQDTLSQAHPDFRIELDDTILTWGGWRRALDIRVINAQAIDSLEVPIAAVPELSVSLSAHALLRGVLAPRRIELFYPTVRLLRLRDGRLQVAMGGDRSGEADFLPLLLQQVMADPDPDQAMSYLTRVDVIDADLTLEDQLLETSWRAPSAQVRLRRDAAGIRGEVDLALDVEGHRAELSALGEYRADDGQLDVGLEFSGLRPSLFARLAPVLEPLSAVAMPLAGTVSATLRDDGAIETVGFDLSGEGGELSLPDPMAQSLPVRRLALRGRFEESGPVVLDDFGIAFAEGNRVLLPASDNHRMPVVALRGNARFLPGDGRLELTRLVLDLDGPRLSVEGTVEGIGTDRSMSLSAQSVLEAVPVDDFDTYWPAGWGNDPRGWCLTNLSKGLMPRAEASVELRMPKDGPVELVSLEGEMDIDRVTVDYLSPMPKARKATGKATFSASRFDITLNHGEVGDLMVRKGTIFLTGLDAYDQYADIELFIDGPVQSAMKLIENEPLGFASAVGLDPVRTGGWASTRLKLDFIIEKTLSMEQVEVSAQTTMRDAFIGEAVLGRNVNKGNLELRVDKRGMDVSGDIELAGIPSQLAWRRNFGEKAPIVNHYELTSRIDDIRDTKDLGVELRPFAGDILTGAANTHISFTDFRGGRSRLRATADLAELTVDLPMIGWSKGAGVGGSMEVGLSIQDGLVTDLDYFTIKARDLTIAGSARYATAGTGLERVDFSQVSYGRTDMKGALIPNQDGSWTVSVHGASFDVGPLFEHLFRDEEAEETEAAGEGLRFSLALDLDNLWLGATERVRNVAGSMTRVGDRWRTVRLEGITGADKPFHVRVRPGGDMERVLDVQAADAGAMLKALGFYDNMVGGSLKLTGRFDDAKPDSPLDGTLEVTQFRVINAPTLAHIISLAAITGILDSLEGEGLGFLKLEVPFSLASGVLDIRDAKSSGVSLGFTAKGRIYTAAEVVELAGTVVPAYAINAVWGEIPILGEILTGGEEGGGVFAARYRMSGSLESPEVSVDPLSALAPGILRHLFGVFDADKEEKTPVQSPAEATPAPEATPVDAEGEQGAVGGL